MLNGRLKGSLFSEDANVKLIDDVFMKGQANPIAVLPCKVRVNDLRWALDAVRLKPGGRIWSLLTGVQPVEVEVPRIDTFDSRVVVSVLGLLHGHQPFRGEKTHMNVGGQRSPHAKATPALSHQDGAKASL